MTRLKKADIIINLITLVGSILGIFTGIKVAKEDQKANDRHLELKYGLTQDPNYSEEEEYNYEKDQRNNQKD